MEISNTNQEQLPEEDLALKQRLELFVSRIQEPEDPALQKQALEELKQEIRAAINDDVNKPLKLLQPHYTTLKAYYQENMQDDSLKELLADVLSVLAINPSEAGDDEPRECLKYRLLGSKDDDFTSWGHEYVNNLVAQIKEEYAEQTETTVAFWGLVEQMIMFYRQNNSVSEAIELITEIYHSKIVNQENYKLACSCLKDVAIQFPREQVIILTYVYDLYTKFNDVVRALEVALFLENECMIMCVFALRGKDILQKKQFCYMLARHGVPFQLDDYKSYHDDIRHGNNDGEMQNIINNLMLSQGYLTLARDYNVMEPKSAKDICKDGSGGAAAGATSEVDPASQILAGTFVNAFLNAGFGMDNLMMGSDRWLFKNKGHGKISAIASFGLICLWDPDNGYAKLDKYFEYNDRNDSYVIAGALLGVGILNSSIKQDSDPVLALLRDYVDNEDPSIRISAIMGLGITYANTQNEQIGKKLMSILDHQTSLDVVAFSAIALGLVYIGSCVRIAREAILRAIRNFNTEAHKSKENMPLMRLLFLGYGLLYLRTTKRAESAVINFNVHQDNQARLSMLSCAYAGTRDEVTQNTLFAECDQEVAVLGMAMVAMGDEMGLDTTIEYLMNLLKNGNQNIKKTVPLALSLLCISNPIRANVIETLHTLLSHNTNSEVVMSAIISLGLVGSGTKNAEIDGKLRDLSNYYSNDDSVLFCVQIAQGLVHLGKGLLTLNPYHSEGFLVSHVAIGGLVTFLYSCLDMNEMVLGKYHFMLYFLVLAMQPKMLITVDENLKPLPVPVRVGRDVDTVSNAGQMFETPVVLSPGEKAILSTNKYVPLSHILEGVVILKNNPEYKEAIEE